MVPEIQVDALKKTVQMKIQLLEYTYKIGRKNIKIFHNEIDKAVRHSDGSFKY